MHIGSRVRLRDLDPSVVTHHGGTQGTPIKYAVDMMTVKETESELVLLWQDGTIEHVNSKDIIPYINSDEHDCW